MFKKCSHCKKEYFVTHHDNLNLCQQCRERNWLRLAKRRFR